MPVPEVVPPASAPTTDAPGAPIAVQPGRFAQYAMAGAQVFRAMAGPMISAVTGLPSLSVNPARVTSTAKGNEVAGVGPQPKSYLESTSQKTDGKVIGVPGALSDKTEIHKPTTAFTTDSSKAHLVINAKGEPEWQAGKMPTKADKEVNVYVDPKFAGAKDPDKVAAAIAKANDDPKLKEAGIQLQKPENMATALKTAQDQQAKAQAEKAKIDKGQNTNPGEKKPIPNGGGGGGGGGGCAPPDKINRPNQGGDKNGGRPNANRTEASTLPKPYTENSNYISDKGGVNNGSYPEFVQAVYSNIQGFSGAGGLMSQFKGIDDNPTLTDEQKAAKKAELMEKFQKEHEKEIKDNTKAYAKDMSDFGDKDSAAGIENIGKNLADPNKAGNIVSMLDPKNKLAERADNKLAADDRNISAVFDEKGRHALTNLALVEKGIDWKAPSKDKNGLTSEGKARADAVSKIVTEPFKFRRR